MTAINPARLKIQTAELGELIRQPDEFKSRLHDLLDFYSARVRQTNLSSTPLRLQTYQAPQPVLQALELEIAGSLEENPEAGFPLLDALWVERWVEFRQLAIYLLGILPCYDPAPILERVRSWLEACSSEEIRHLIMIQGMSKLAQEKPQQCLAFIEDLIKSGSKADHQAALFGLEIFATNSAFLNLPLIYRYLSHILATEETGLRKEIRNLLETLIIRSEQETTYFLGQQLAVAAKPRIERVTRQVLGQLSPTNQQFLRLKLEAGKEG